MVERLDADGAEHLDDLQAGVDGLATDYSPSTSRTPAATRGQDAIQALQADGFQVGTRAARQHLGDPHYYGRVRPGPHRTATTTTDRSATAADYATRRAIAVTATARRRSRGRRDRVADRQARAGRLLTSTARRTYMILSVWLGDGRSALTQAVAATRALRYTIGRQYRPRPRASQMGELHLVRRPLRLLPGRERRTSCRRPPAEVGIATTDSDCLRRRPDDRRLTTDAAHTITLTVGWQPTPGAH